MNFRRWLFYNPETGKVTYSGMQEGSFIPLPVEDVAEAFGVSGSACLEWTSPDPEIEGAFAPTDAEGNPRIVTVTVDVSGPEPKVVFTYGPVQETADETADMAAALRLLGVEPEEEGA